LGAANAVIFALFVLGAVIRLAYFNVIEEELQSKNERRKYYEGLPTTSVSLIITLAYSVCDIFGYSLAAVYPALLAVISAAFVLRIKIPKPRGISMAVLCLISAPVVIYVFYKALGG
jgi:CDP-diacylglycerol--serine O-phosphatidyltransferase